MPQIDFYVLSQLTTLCLALALTLVFMAVHAILLKEWLSAAVKIAFLVSLVNDMRLIRLLVSEAVIGVFFCPDFLEQFIIILISAAVVIFSVYLYASLCFVLFNDFISSFLLSVLRSIIFSYSILELLFLRKFVPFFFTSFIIIFLFNVIGMIPNAFTFTSSLSIPFFFGLVTFFIWLALVFLPNPAKSVKFFLHGGTNPLIAPLIALIEIISHFSKFISLSVRLFANMFAGHLLLKAFYSFIFILLSGASLANFIFGSFALAFTLFIVALEFLIAFLQAYVALLLMVLYISGVRIFSQEH